MNRIALLTPLGLTLTLSACADRFPTATGAISSMASPETKVGYIVGRNGEPRATTYSEQAGYAISEGDIIIGRAGEIAETAEQLRLRISNKIRAGVIIDGNNFRWPGYVTYEIDPALPDKARVTAAIALVELNNVGVFFYPRAGEANYIRFVSPPTNVCNSYVGLQGGMQPINLGPGCSAGAAAHEILHALGMWHEQSRCDRDAYVEILAGNVIPSTLFNFDRVCDGASDLELYSEGSIMHYGPYSFSANGQPTIRSRRGLDYLMGNRSALNASDVATLRAMYVTNGVLRCKGTYPNGPCITRPIDERLSIVGPGGPYEGIEGQTITFSAGEPVSGMTYTWNFGDDSIGIQSTVSHTYQDNGPFTVLLTLTNSVGENTTKTTTATIANANPTASFVAPAAAFLGASFTISLDNPEDAVADLSRLTFAFDCGIGWSPFTSTNTATCSANVASGGMQVQGKVRDKDGGETSYSATVTINSPDQVIIFSSAAPNPGLVGTTYLVSATGGGSPNPVTFSSLTLATCAVSGATVQFLAIGTCTIAADQAGGSGFNPAPRITQGIGVMATQAILFLSTPPSPLLIGTSYGVTTAGGASGNPVVLSSQTPSICTLKKSTAKMLAPGLCVIAANQAGGSGYLAAPEKTQSAIVLATQVIRFTSTPPLKPLVGGSYAMTATGGQSGNPVVFTSLTPTVCGVVNDVAQFTTAGVCTIAANQAGTSTYAAATQVTQTVRIKN